MHTAPAAAQGQVAQLLDARRSPHENCYAASMADGAAPRRADRPCKSNTPNIEP